MSETITPAAIGAAALRICTMIDARASRFNQLDAATGDGDMGSTLQIVARAILGEVTPFPADVGESFGRLAAVVARTSGSSLCAVIMAGLMSLARSNSGKTSITVDEFVTGLRAALEVMQRRSGARFGDKTILDGLNAVVSAAEGVHSLTALGDGARRGAISALDSFRSQPSQIGRARLAENRGIGLDDPGMAFLSEALQVLGERPR